MGCGQHPAFPAPSDFRRVNQASNPGAIAQRERELASRRRLKLTWIRAPFSARCASACTNLALCRQAGWLGFLDTYRTLCLAPPAEILALFEELRLNS